jgi:hypothetical protein
MNRRAFLGRAAGAGALAGVDAWLLGQDRGDRPQPSPSPEVRVLNPRGRVPVGIIIDDSTCLVNLNRFAMPQFDEAWKGANSTYHKPWKEWPAEIPDSFVRRFAEWAIDRGVKGKYSVVPFPSCVGRLDRVLPGWSRAELDASLRLVREVLLSHWDIHPEMITHTRVIDLKTGHPYPEPSLKYMENWDWTTGRSADEITAYLAYALSILKNVDLPCEGITTPGGFGNRARPQLAQASFESVRSVFGAEIPHYFRDLYDEGDTSVAPRVELASGLDGSDPRCVVSIIGCTGDWTGGWDCTEPGGADLFLTSDLAKGRLVDVIERGEPALMVCHWTGIYWNGRELGFQIFQEVERRLRARYADRTLWMKLSEVARYWAAKELTHIQRAADSINLRAPFACPAFTCRFAGRPGQQPALKGLNRATPLREVTLLRDLAAGTWHREGETFTVCVDLPRGESSFSLTPVRA